MTTFGAWIIEEQERQAAVEARELRVGAAMMGFCTALGIFGATTEGGAAWPLYAVFAAFWTVKFSRQAACHSEAA